MPHAHITAACIPTFHSVPREILQGPGNSAHSQMSTRQVKCKVALMILLPGLDARACASWKASLVPPAGVSAPLGTQPHRRSLPHGRLTVTSPLQPAHPEPRHGTPCPRTGKCCSARMSCKCARLHKSLSRILLPPGGSTPRIQGQPWTHAAGLSTNQCDAPDHRSTANPRCQQLIPALVCVCKHEHMHVKLAGLSGVAVW